MGQEKRNGEIENSHKLQLETLRGRDTYEYLGLDETLKTMC